jgi:hypothetical protein
LDHFREIFNEFKEIGKKKAMLEAEVESKIMEKKFELFKEQLKGMRLILSKINIKSYNEKDDIVHQMDQIQKDLQNFV